VSLIYSILGEVRSFSATPAVADRREGDPVNRWSPYFLSILRIIAAFVYGVHGSRSCLGFLRRSRCRTFRRCFWQAA